MQLRKLLSPGYTGENQVPARITGGIDFEVESLAHDSRAVENGAVFFALPGRKTTGSHFVEVSGLVCAQQTYHQAHQV